MDMPIHVLLMYFYCLQAKKLELTKTQDTEDRNVEHD